MILDKLYTAFLRMNADMWLIFTLVVIKDYFTFIYAADSVWHTNARVSLAFQFLEHPPIFLPSGW